MRVFVSIYLCLLTFTFGKICNNCNGAFLPAVPSSASKRFNVRRWTEIGRRNDKGKGDNFVNSDENIAEEQLTEKISSLFRKSPIVSNPKGERSNFNVDNDDTSIVSGNVTIDAPYLDATSYLQFSDDPSDMAPTEFSSLMSKKRIDGDHDKIKQLRLNLLQHSNPNIPEEYFTKRTDGVNTNVTGKDVRKNSESIGEKAKETIIRESDMLHRQVFENEQGYLKQSKVFRTSLSNQQEGKDRHESERQAQGEIDAVAWRRGIEYRKRQKEAIKTVEMEMKDLMQHPSFLITDTRSDKIDSSTQIVDKDDILTCSKCTSPLTANQVARIKKKTKSDPKLWGNLLCMKCYFGKMNKDTRSNVVSSEINSKGNTRLASLPSALMNKKPLLDLNSKSNFEKNKGVQVESEAACFTYQEEDSKVLFPALAKDKPISYHPQQQTNKENSRSQVSASSTFTGSN